MDKVRVANGLGIFAREKVHGGHIAEHGNLAVEHGNINVLALATALTFIQCGQHPDHAKHTAAQIGDGQTGAQRALGTVTGNRHIAAVGLYNLVKRGAVVTRAFGAKAGNRAGNNARVYFFQHGVVNTELLGDTDTEIIKHDIGLFDQLIKQRFALFTFQVDGDAFLIAIEINKVGAHTVDGVLRVIGEQAPRALTF